MLPNTFTNDCRNWPAREGEPWLVLSPDDAQGLLAAVPVIVLRIGRAWVDGLPVNGDHRSSFTRVTAGEHVVPQAGIPLQKAVALQGAQGLAHGLPGDPPFL